MKYKMESNIYLSLSFPCSLRLPFSAMALTKKGNIILWNNGIENDNDKGSDIDIEREWYWRRRPTVNPISNFPLIFSSL